MEQRDFTGAVTRAQQLLERALAQLATTLPPRVSAGLALPSHPLEPEGDAALASAWHIVSLDAAALPGDAVDDCGAPDAALRPIALEVVERLWEAGIIDGEALAWRAGMRDWLPLRDVPELAFVLTHDRPRPETEPETAGEQTEEHGGAAGGWRPAAAPELGRLANAELQRLAPAGVAASAPLSSSPPMVLPSALTPEWAVRADALAYPFAVPVPTAARRRRRRQAWWLGALSLAMTAAMVMVLVSTQSESPRPVDVADVREVAGDVMATPIAASPPPAVAPSLAPAPLAGPATRSEPPASLRAPPHEPASLPPPPPRTPPLPRRAPQPALPRVKELRTRAEVAAAALNQREALIPCLAAARQRGELAPGTYTFVVDWTIEPSGSVVQARLKAPASLLLGSLPECFAAKIREWRFEPATQRTPVSNYAIGPVTVR